MDMDGDLTGSAPLGLFGTDSITPRGAALLKSIPPGAMSRAARIWIAATGVREHAPRSVGFLAGFCVGEGEALRRAAVALSDPRAKGHEREVVIAMEDGLSVEDALRRASKPKPPPDPGGGNVVSFRR